MLADGVVEFFGLELLAPHTIPQAIHPPLRAGNQRILDEGYLIVLLALGHKSVVVLLRTLVLEICREQLRERIAVRAILLLVIKALTAKIEEYRIAEYRGRQRLAIAGEDCSAMCQDLLLREDSALEFGGIDLRVVAQELNANQSTRDKEAHNKEEQVQNSHSQQDIFLYLLWFLRHNYSITSLGRNGSYNSKPRSRRASTMAECDERR